MSKLNTHEEVITIEMRIIVTRSRGRGGRAYRRDYCVAGKVLHLIIVMVTMVFTLKLIKQFINVYTHSFARVYICILSYNLKM